MHIAKSLKCALNSLVYLFVVNIYGNDIVLEFLNSDKESFYHKDFKIITNFYNTKLLDSAYIYSGDFIENAKLNKKQLWFCYYIRGLYLKSERKFNEAANYFEKIPNSCLLFTKVKLFKADIKLEQGYFDEAEIIYQLLLKHHKSRFVSTIHNIYNNLGICYLHKGNFNLSEKYLHKAIHSSLGFNDINFYCIVYTNLGLLYYEMYNDSLAYKYLKESLKLSNTIENESIIKIDVLYNLSIYHENSKDYNKSLYFRKLYDEHLSNELASKAYNQIFQLEKNNILKRKNEIINSFKEENSSVSYQNKLLVYLALILKLVFIFTCFKYLKIKTFTKNLSINFTKLQNKKVEQDHIYSIVGHDLKSYLSVMVTLQKSILKDFASADISYILGSFKRNLDITKKTQSVLSNLFHWALIQSNNFNFNFDYYLIDKIFQSVLFDFKEFIELKKIIIITNIPDDLLCYADYDSLKIVFRNLIDNAIKYNIDNGEIYIKVTVIEDIYLRICISNSTNAVKIDKINSLGQKLCTSIVENNGGFIKFESQENTYNCNIKLKIKNE